MMTGAVDQLEQQQQQQQQSPPLNVVANKRLVINHQVVANNHNSVAPYELVFCKVCNQPTVNRIRCGVLACEACKKFFQRNRENADTLRCVSGTFDCPLSDDRAALTSSGTVWRLVCPRCRLAKCLAVGMRVLGRKTKTAAASNKQQQQKQRPGNTNDQPSTSGVNDGKDSVSNSGDSPSGDGATSDQSSILARNNKKKLVVLKGDLFDDINNLQARLTPAHQKLLLNSTPLMLNNCTRFMSAPSTALNLSSTAAKLPPFLLGPGQRQTLPSPPGLADETPMTSVIRPTPIIAPSRILARANSPMNFDNIRQEELLNLTVNATRDLSHRYETLPLRNNIATMRNEVSTWQCSMQHFEAASRHIMSFANQLPGFDQLPAEDRCLLLANAISPLSSAQNIQSPLPFTMNSLNAANFMRFFPEFSFSTLESVNMHRTLSSWNPSTAEYSLLMALLLYRNHPGLSNPALVQSIIGQLKSVHESLLAQEHPNDPNAVADRVRQLSQIVDVLRSTATSRLESFEAMKARRPDLLQQGKLYRKVYSSVGGNKNSDSGDQEADAAATSSPTLPSDSKSSSCSPPDTSQHLVEN